MVQRLPVLLLEVLQGLRDPPVHVRIIERAREVADVGKQPVEHIWIRFGAGIALDRATSDFAKLVVGMRRTRYSDQLKALG